MLLPADDDALTLNPTCFANTAELEIAFSESDDINIRVRIDYICIGNDSEKVGGQVSAMGGWSVLQAVYILHIGKEVASILQYHTAHS